ncbi:YerC [Paenibacillus mucilaginosus 3016]|uniref:YerC n=13 Tax=Paenibacillus TaxID=44249 RepID=H6NPR5_9BACL|nr:YerC [Paenibacillus mucilaginosus 3016]
MSNMFKIARNYVQNCVRNYVQIQQPLTSFRMAERGLSADHQGVEGTMQLKKLNDKAIDQLFEAILTLKDIEECYVFFDDLCTVNEIQSLSQRLEVARMLRKGNTYNQIEAETGASTATISRVKRCLNYGNDGYKMTLERLGR